MVGDIFQPTHLLFVLVVALLVLGPKRLPEVGRTLGSGIRDFRQALSGESHDSGSRAESEQVSSAATDWPEEAVGPTSFDEPVIDVPAEPAHTATGDAETAAGDSYADDARHTAETGHTDAATHTDPAGHTDTAEPHTTPAPGVGATPEEELAFSEHELGRQAADSDGSSESQTPSRD